MTSEGYSNSIPKRRARAESAAAAAARRGDVLLPKWHADERLGAEPQDDRSVHGAGGPRGPVGPNFGASACA